METRNAKLMAHAVGSWIDRFWTRVDFDGPDGCWLWTGNIDHYGYGTFHRSSSSGPTRKAHRIAWNLAFGDIGDELTVDHLCRVKACANPDHMELVTRAENTRRATEAARSC